MTVNTDYSDIINMPHHVSEKRPHMSIEDRAAQFSPFAALTGFGAEVTEAGRLTDRKLILDENKIKQLNDYLMVINQNISDKPLVDITYFEPDEKKAGGEYITVSGHVKKIDNIEQFIVLETEDIISEDGLIFIDIENICDIQTELIKKYFGEF